MMAVNLEQDVTVQGDGMESAFLNSATSWKLIYLVYVSFCIDQYLFSFPSLKCTE